MKKLDRALEGERGQLRRRRRKMFERKGGVSRSDEKSSHRRGKTTPGPDWGETTAPLLGTSRHCGRQVKKKKKRPDLRGKN